MRLAPSYPRVAGRSAMISDHPDTYAETRRAYAAEGEVGAGSFCGYFRVSGSLRGVSLYDAYVRAKTVLDLGSGSGGRSAYWKKDVGARGVVGLDIFPDEVITAHKTVSRMGIQVSFAVGFGEAMPLRDALFDTVLSFDVLEHVRHPAEVLRECYRVLVPGGTFLIVFPPFYHPTGHHLSYVTKSPWLQLFDANAVTLAFNDIVDARGETARWYRRGPLAPYEKLGWLNGMTVGKFRKIVKSQGWKIEFWDCLPLLAYGWVVKKRPYLKWLSWPIGVLSRLPGLCELFTHRVVCILCKAG